MHSGCSACGKSYVYMNQVRWLQVIKSFLSIIRSARGICTCTSLLRRITYRGRGVSADLKVPKIGADFESKQGFSVDVKEHSRRSTLKRKPWHSGFLPEARYISPSSCFLTWFIELTFWFLFCLRTGRFGSIATGVCPMVFYETLIYSYCGLVPNIPKTLNLWAWMHLISIHILLYIFPVCYGRNDMIEARQIKFAEQFVLVLLHSDDSGFL